MIKIKATNMLKDSSRIETGWDSEQEKLTSQTNDYEETSIRWKNLASFDKKCREYQEPTFFANKGKGKCQGRDQIDDYEQYPANNEYSFLRNVWTRHRHQDQTSVDDKIDHLSKVVAVIKGHLSTKIIQEKVNMAKNSNKNSFMWQAEYQKLKEKYEKSMMRGSELQATVLKLQIEIQKITNIYQSTKEEAKRSKDQLRALENKYLEVCKREQELIKKISKSQDCFRKIEKQQEINKELHDSNERSLLKVRSGMIRPFIESILQEKSERIKERNSQLAKTYLIMQAQKSPKEENPLLTELSDFSNNQPLQERKLSTVKSQRQLIGGKFIRKNIHTGRFIELKRKIIDGQSILDERKFFSKQILSQVK